MGFFNPIAYFIKCFFKFLRSITGKLFVIFVLLFAVLILYMCIDKGVFAYSTSTYGNYQGFSSSDIFKIDSVISQYKDNYDSFLCRYWKSRTTTFRQAAITFYNFNTNGNLIHSFDENFEDFRAAQIDGQTSVDGSVLLIYFDLDSYNGANLPLNYISSPGLKTRFIDNIPALYTNRIIYTDSSYNSIYFTGGDNSIAFFSPYFVTTEQDIQNWNFDFLEISGGDVPYYTTSGGTTPIFGNTYLELTLTYNYVNYDIDISQFIVPDYDNNTWSIKIPKNYLFNYVNVQNGIDFKFTLYAEQQYPFEQYSVETNNMTFNLTTEQLAEINNDTNKQIQGTIVQQQQEIVQGQQDLNNSINNDHIDDMSSDFTNLGNGLTAEDNTGIDTIFQKLYDAFCSNEIQAVSLTIPFVNKSFTIDTNGISKNFPEAVKSIVAVFVWGVIGLWVLKDIRTIIDKISEGSPEDVGSDVKKEVL